MAFTGTTNFSHQQPDKVGVLVTNLGTPEAPTPKALRAYLAEFLSDPRVVEIPRLLWMLILHGIILRVRPKKSAHAYETVWTDQGSPLLIHTQAQAQALKENLKAVYGDGVHEDSGGVHEKSDEAQEKLVVDFAMRYGQPSIQQVVDQMMAQGVRKLVVLPLYPQYSGSTTASTFDAIAKDFTQRRWLPEFRFVSSYHDHPLYIEALANKVKAHWEQHGKADKLILSFHGIPQHFLHQGDPYHCQCLVTARLLAEKLALPAEAFIATFQSRFGKAEWLKPYTDATLQSLPSQGVKSVQVMCPGFSADCLETIEEIGVENRDYFLEAGGERYEYIPALNADDEHIHALTDIVRANIDAWMSLPSEDVKQRQKRFEQCPHNHKK